METKPIPQVAEPSLDPEPPPRRRPVSGIIAWTFTVLALVVVGGLSMPCFACVQVRGSQTKALAQAKQIGMALRQYAADHDGNYPRAGQPEMLGAIPTNSNAAFAVLFPDYLTSESIFGNKLSAYQTRPPDNEIDPHYTGHPVKTLEPGENVYAYVTGLNNDDNPAMPLVVDGTDGTGHYVTDPKKRGGVWKGAKSVVIRLDLSGAVENLRGPDNARYVLGYANPVPSQTTRPARPSENLLDFSDFGPDVRLLDPAVVPR